MPTPELIVQNRNIVKENCRNRNIPVNLDLIEKLFKEQRQSLKTVEELRAKMNRLAERTKAATEDERKSLIKEGRRLKPLLQSEERHFREINSLLKEEFYKVPNITHPDAPIGQSDKDNVEVRRVGEIPKFEFKPRDHVTLGKLLGVIDFEGGTRVAGSKFYFLKNEGVLLDLALTQYVLNILEEKGFTLFITPDLAKLEIIDGIGFNPRGVESQIYTIESTGLGLIATAEITLGGLFRNQIVDESMLPLKMAGLSHCFRREAGAYGRASKGLYRVHQFNKVEMFALATPEKSDEMLEYLVSIEEEIFSGLKIPFRIVDCCTGDLGAAAYRKFDLEAWIPSENRWGEITSASNCTDYQAQRLDIKFRRKKLNKKELVHTLNGTGVATSRAILAILENFQQEDGSVKIPQKLQPIIGKEVISPRQA